MGLIGIIKPLFTVLSSAVSKSQQHQEKNSWGCRASNLGEIPWVPLAARIRFAPHGLVNKSLGYTSALSR